MFPIPFSPERLDAYPEPLAELARGLEIKLLEEICSRLKAAGQLNEVTVQDIRSLRSHGIGLKEIKEAISEYANISEKELDKLLDDVVERNQKYYTETIDIAKVTNPARLVNAKDVEAIRKQAFDDFANITRSMGFLLDAGRTFTPPAKAYQWALNNALVQVQSGAISYNEAITSAIRQLADSGIKTVDYESGHVDSVDVAVRRAVMSATNKLNQKYREQSMDYLETDLVETTAHSGARDTGVGFQNHKAWQGKWYRWKKHPKTSTGDYPDFDESCAPDDVQGIGGANCRHSYYAVIEGINEPTYTQEQLDNIDPPPFEFDGKTYSAYEATQMQRRIERSIRKQKRRKAAFEAAGMQDDAAAAGSKLRMLNKKYKDFSAAAGLPEQRERMAVLYDDNTPKIRGNSAGGESSIPGVPEKIGEVDFSDKDAVIRVLESGERDALTLETEVNYTVTSDGSVWRVPGDKSSVNPSAIPSDLTGSYSYHNHPPSVTNYSFSGEDVSWFISKKEAYSKASDDTYQYFMRRLDNTIEKSADEVYNRFKEIEKKYVYPLMWDGIIDPDIDRYHEVLKILSAELRFDYDRKKRN